MWPLLKDNHENHFQCEFGVCCSSKVAVRSSLPFYDLIYFHFMYRGFACMYVYHMWVLGTELGSSVRAASTLKGWSLQTV